MKALKILKENRLLLVQNDSELDFFAIDEAISELEALQQHIKDLESQLSSNPLQLTCDGCKNCDENMWCTFFANGTTVLHNFYCLGHEPKDTK